MLENPGAGNPRQKLEKPVDVVCVFYKGKLPEPRKFKIAYDDGVLETVLIDQIVSAELVHAYGLCDNVVVYKCKTHFFEHTVSYELQYRAKEMKWVITSIY